MKILWKEVTVSTERRPCKMQKTDKQKKTAGPKNDMLIHQYQIEAEQICIFLKNNKEDLPIVLQE
jgi:hypothetical protein